VLRVPGIPIARAALLGVKFKAIRYARAQVFARKTGRPTSRRPSIRFRSRPAYRQWRGVGRDDQPASRLAEEWIAATAMNDRRVWATHLNGR
jgi:hypothetical protein